MLSRDFCYWLQGFFELSGKKKAMTKEQVGVIEQHLAMVFVHEIDPSMGTKAEQQILSEIHGSTSSRMPHSSPLITC